MRQSGLTDRRGSLCQISILQCGISAAGSRLQKPSILHNVAIPDLRASCQGIELKGMICPDESAVLPTVLLRMLRRVTPSPAVIHQHKPSTTLTDLLVFLTTKMHADTCPRGNPGLSRPHNFETTIPLCSLYFHRTGGCKRRSVRCCALRRSYCIPWTSASHLINIARRTF